MKTTVIIADPLMTQARREAAKQGLSISALMEAALRFFLHNQRQPRKKLRPLPKFDGGPFLVDVADRQALQEKLGGRW